MFVFCRLIICTNNITSSGIPPYASLCNSYYFFVSSEEQMVQQTPAAKLVNKYPHMNVLEPEKLQWMQDLPPSKSLSEACPYNARFSFDGKFSFIIENVSVAKYCSSLDIQIQYSSTCTELPSRLFVLIRYRI